MPEQGGDHARESQYHQRHHKHEERETDGRCLMLVGQLVAAGVRAVVHRAQPDLAYGPHQREHAHGDDARPRVMLEHLGGAGDGSHKFNDHTEEDVAVEGHGSVLSYRVSSCFPTISIVPVALKRGVFAGGRLFTGVCGETIFRNVCMRLFWDVSHIGWFCMFATVDCRGGKGLLLL